MAQAALALIVWLCVTCAAIPVATAQDKSARQASAARPQWSELSPRQQHVLSPLAPEWNNLDTVRRKKWVDISNRYPKMKADEQVRLQRRMQTWAKLSPEQRRVAREKYRAIKKLPPVRRQNVRQNWQQYQQSLWPQTSANDTAAQEPTTETGSASPNTKISK